MITFEFNAFPFPTMEHARWYKISLKMERKCFVILVKGFDNFYYLNSAISGPYEIVYEIKRIHSYF
jgi:hypothetical protein